MRIGMMCHASFGGSARIGIELAIALAGRGHRVHLFTRTTPLVGWDRSNGVVLHTLLPDATDTLHPATLHTDWSDRDLQRYTESILQVIADEHLDVLHFHYAVPFAFVAQNVRRCLGDMAPRLVGTLHGTDVTHFGKDPHGGAETGRRAALQRRADHRFLQPREIGCRGVQPVFSPARRQ